MNLSPSEPSWQNWLDDPGSGLRTLDAELCRRSLAEFIRLGWHVLEPTTPLEWNWHVDAIAAHVQATLEDWMGKQANPEFDQRIQNLLINVPPGTGKSRFVSVFAPAWMWLRWSSWRAICFSSNPRVALRDSVFCRELITSDWYRETFRPPWELADDQNAKSLFRNTAGGSRQAMGFGGRVTGDRGDCLLIDDPHDADEVNSIVARTAVLERWDTAVGNRVNDLRSSTRIGVMQRVHDQDWSGHVLAQGGWEHLMIPMEFEPDRARTTAIGWRDPRTEAGELLFPQRFPPEVLAAEKRRLGSFGYAGQHQQRPVPADGGSFKRSWFRSWRLDPAAPEFYRLDAPAGPRLVKAATCRRFGVVDLAFSLKKEADYTVLSAWAASEDSDLILLDLHRERLEGPDLIPALLRWQERHGVSYWCIEANGAQLAIVQDARRRGLAVRALRAETDKVTRSLTAQVRTEAGQVYFPAVAPWLGDFEAELLAFPKGVHDDMVDCLSYASLEVFKRGGADESDDTRKAREAVERVAAAKAQEQWLDPGNDALWENF